MKELDKNFTFEELAAFVDTYRQQNNPVTTPPERGIKAMTEAAAYMVAKLNNCGAFAGAKRHTDPEDKACQCGAKICRPGCACSKSRLFLDVAKDLKISPAKLYNLLHKERVLFRLRGTVRNSDERKHYGFAVTYADFTGTNLFERETVVDANGFTSCRLRVFSKGISFIEALISNAAPDAKEIYRTVFPGEKLNLPGGIVSSVKKITETSPKQVAKQYSSWLEVLTELKLMIHEAYTPDILAIAEASSSSIRKVIMTCFAPETNEAENIVVESAGDEQMPDLVE